MWEVTNGSGNGLLPERQKAITWANGNPAYGVARPQWVIDESEMKHKYSHIHQKRNEQARGSTVKSLI